ncbi:MAG TPA: family 78 glycoside hydrolase catalytic domain [Clostridia bacterium]|nr:family 78 glycoside hydrolase catalytic domain [Clostridia bacterium]
MKSHEVFKTAKWVAPEKNCFQPYIRGEFFAPKTETAEIIICGLGFFELYINGKKVEDDFFVPVWSDYCDHPTFNNGKPTIANVTHRIYCVKYDISKYIKQGENSIGVLLGGGWFKKWDYGDRALLCYIINLSENGKSSEIYSDESLKWRQSYITDSEIMLGERHDYRLEIEGCFETDFNSDDWKNVEVVDAPESNFFIQDCPTDKIIRQVEPKLVKKFKNYSVYDVGENITGWPVIKLPEKSGEEVNVFYAEQLDSFKRLITDTVGATHIDTYISDGRARECHPHFMWQAFRYFSVTNNAQVVRCEVVHSNVDVTSSFESDSKVLNWLYTSFIRTQLDNMHCSIPSDCPQREGRGYTGDGQLACDAAMLVLDAQSFYRKWLSDISDCQDTQTGHVQYTAPYVVSGGGPGGWGCAIVHVPYVYYKMYDDKAVLEEFFPKMLRYFEYLDAHSENELVVSDEEGAWCLGDWCTPGKIKIPEPFVNNYFYVKSLNEAIEIAKLIGRDEIIPELEQKAEIKKQALLDNYFDAKKGTFAKDVQGANSFAIDLGLGNSKTLPAVVDKYQKRKMYDTGIFGTDILTRVLFENGYPQLAFDLLTSKKKVSFNTIMKKGATTLWEYWDGDKSQNHPMFGAVVRYLFTELLGIKQTENSAGFDEVVISPANVSGLDYVKGHIEIKNGKIAVCKRIQDKKVKIDVEIPSNVNAVLRFDNKSIKLKEGKHSFEFGA